MNTTKQYSEMVTKLSKPGEEILAAIRPEQAEALHMGILAATEAGELLDAIKKWSIYQKDLDFKNVIEEMGDIEFAMERLRQMFDLPRELILRCNIQKLGKRYPEGSYSDKAAQDRADKKGEEL